MSTKSYEQRRRNLRSLRVGAIGGLTPSLIFVPLDIFVLHTLWAALVQSLLLLACASTVALVTRKMRRLVNWPSVYRMEREVWGRTFEHEGAPGELAIRPQSPFLDAAAGSMTCSSLEAGFQSLADVMRAGMVTLRPALCPGHHPYSGPRDSICAECAELIHVPVAGKKPSVITAACTHVCDREACRDLDSWEWQVTDPRDGRS